MRCPTCSSDAPEIHGTPHHEVVCPDCGFVCHNCQEWYLVDELYVPGPNPIYSMYPPRYGVGECVTCQSRVAVSG
jgi:hypothetical protein